MFYCKTCILPSTRPNIFFDDFQNCCSITTNTKKNIDWVNREKQFKKLVNETKEKNCEYDCIIPVSGGKDSTWQVINALNYGMKPLCVTWKTPARNTLGAKNLQNLVNLGVDHIDFSINPKVEKRFTLRTFCEKGSPVIPMHMALHAIPLQIAIKFKIPLILWGENSAFEYGGNDQSLKGVRLNLAWLKKYGVTNGTTAQDWIDEDLTLKDLSPYIWPNDEEQRKAKIKAVFLGHFFNWDPVKIASEAKMHGFDSSAKPKTGYYNFADIDDAFLITIHHHMKWYKFGFTRLWDNLSLEIRNGRITRDQAIDIVRVTAEKEPILEIELFCEYLGISMDRYYKIAETFRNKHIWSRRDGRWKIDNFLIKDWEWV